MAHWTFALGLEPVAGQATFREADNAVFLAGTAGELVSCRLLDGEVRVHGGGYVEPVAVLPATDGLGLWVVEAGGRILQAYRGEAAAAQAVLMADLGQPIRCARLRQDGSAILAVVGDGAATRLLSVAAPSGLDTLVAEEFAAADAWVADMVLDDPGGRLVMLETGAGGSRLLVVDLVAATVEAAPLPSPADASRLVLCGGRLIVAGADGALVHVGLDGQPIATGPDQNAPVRGLAAWGSLLLVVTDASLLAIEWALEPGLLRLPSPAPAFAGGGWIAALLGLDAAGLGRDDVELVVEEGPDAGSVSVAIEPAADDGLAPYRVLAGIRTGEFHLTALLKATGDVLGRGRFRVQAHWPSERSGPPVAITGEQGHYAFGNWGGGPPVAQNIKVLPAPENFRVAMVLVETRDRGFAPDTTALKDSWKERLVGTNSVRSFYEEASLLATPPGAFVKGTTVTLVGDRVFGPIALPDGWGDYFKDRETAWKGWLTKDDTRQAFATAFCEWLMDQGISDPVLRNTDAVVFLVRTASDQPATVGSKMLTAKFAWPSAYGAFFNYKTEFATSQRRIPLVIMPDDYPTGIPAGDRFPWGAALAHELGHNLGLEDLYDAKERFPAEVDARAVGAIDLMGNGWPHPTFSLPNRMRLGWVDPAWIERIDFASDPNGRSVMLQATSALARSALPAGRKAGIEVRIRDGWNYYFEYRRSVAGQVGDQQLAASFGAGQLIAGLDVMSSGKPEASRPIIELVPNDPDGDGPVLIAAGRDFEDSDLTNPEGMHDFRLVFDQIDPVDPNAARVRIEYVRARRPELQITPAPGNGDWKSPDINIDGKLGANRIAKGLPHKVRIRVRNAGVRAATQVRVGVRLLPFTLASGGSWQSLADPPRLDLGPGEQKEFVTDWDVPASVRIGDVEVEHFCIRADIDRYVDPTDPVASEIVVHNNWAQSNFDTNAVASGSPSDRIATVALVANGLDREATYLVDAVQDSRHFRVYLGHVWLRLQPGEARPVALAYETLAGDPQHGAAFAEEFGERGLRDIDRVSITSFILPAEEMACRSPRLWWGVNLALRAGWRTGIGRIARTGEVIRGMVESEAGGGRHGVGEGRVALALWLDGRFDTGHELTADLEPDGRFSIGLPGDLLALLEGGVPAEGEVLFLGTGRYATCRSGRQDLRG